MYKLRMPLFVAHEREEVDTPSIVMNNTRMLHSQSGRQTTSWEQEEEAKECSRCNAKTYACDSSFWTGGALLCRTCNTTILKSRTSLAGFVFGVLVILFVIYVISVGDGGGDAGSGEVS